MSDKDFLGTMAAGSRARLERARQRLDERELRARLTDRPAPPELRLDPSGFDLIAEIKPRSPAAGPLISGEHAAPSDRVGMIERQAAAYARGGACAVSVLTEPDRFDGSLGYLSTAAAAVTIPAMRKDFLVDPYQVLEARHFGAGGVLVIARMVPDRLDAMIETAYEQGMFVLLEAFDESDVELCATALERLDRDVRDNCLLGVNARDLRTLRIDAGRLQALYAKLPEQVITVAESGLDGREDVAAVARTGYRAVLVGSALMKSSDPESAVAAMLESGRDARKEVESCT